MKPRLTLLVPALLFAAPAPAATPVGAWTGRIDVAIPKLPPNLTSAQKAMVAKSIAQIKNGRIYLTVKADHTYTSRNVNLPSLPPTSKGTWSQKGNVVTMTKASPRGPRAQAFTLAANGKSMSFRSPPGTGVSCSAARRRTAPRSARPRRSTRG